MFYMAHGKNRNVFTWADQFCFMVNDGTHGEKSRETEFHRGRNRCERSGVEKI